MRLTILLLGVEFMFNVGFDKGLVRLGFQFPATPLLLRFHGNALTIHQTLHALWMTSRVLETLRVYNDSSYSSLTYASMSDKFIPLQSGTCVRRPKICSVVLEC